MKGRPTQLGRAAGSNVMAFRDFWISVRTGARMAVPTRVIAAQPRIDAARIESSLRNADFWLTPKVVAGFNKEDFDFLPDAERDRLADLVAQFKEIASKVKPRSPAPDDLRDQALPLFREIIQQLDFGRYEDAEAYRIGKQVEQRVLPDWSAEIEELRFRTGLDHTGDPGLWILAILRDEVSTTDEQFLEAVDRVRPWLNEAAREVAPDRFPYPSFRSSQEHWELIETL
jgi:hypothetical protein